MVTTGAIAPALRLAGRSARRRGALVARADGGALQCPGGEQHPHAVAPPGTARTRPRPSPGRPGSPGGGPGSPTPTRNTSKGDQQEAGRRRRRRRVSVAAEKPPLGLVHAIQRRRGRPRRRTTGRNTPAAQPDPRPARGSAARRVLPGGRPGSRAGYPSLGALPARFGGRSLAPGTVIAVPFCW